MSIQTVGIYSPGDMGQAIATVLSRHGVKTIAALDDRTQRTRHLANEANIENAGDLKQLVSKADLVLSVLVPSAAVQAAAEIAIAIRAVGKPLLYADCNAIAPQKVNEIAQIIENAGGQFIDASIIGPPPRVPNRTRIYASGTQTNRFAELQNYGLDVRVIGEQIGQASGLKMCYAALTKGLTEIGTELLIAAHRLGLEQPLEDELSNSQKGLLSLLTRSIPGMTPKAHRWIGEMEEIADTFQALGLTELTFRGAAEVYRSVKETPLGQETPEEADRTRSLADIISTLSNEG
ncbi:MAG: DUF1932 domain-containing protein [Plectolyngbya sp. WJT66-NPBG17]|jgi:3-hydroxyisobutyrate dehydrogenase-like beta-hydroxyacid dehydrogenase|nr:DUF1932 domain-containing protein [Plectolyngbya sp. WJT66-NPBG17]